MATYEERLASFAPRKQKSSKRSAVNASLAKGWPHPSTFVATPNSLAHAGFYFDPTTEKSDNVTCFTCEHSLAAWTASDDPFKEHLNVDPKCPWAVARCNMELDRRPDGSFVFTVAARLPSAKALEKARVDTFKGFWIHDQTKGHTANSRKMAKAGWIFNPGPGEESDIATCFYCGKSLDGWEAGDDPTHEHRTRVPNCPVFTAKLTAEQRSPPAEASQPSSSTERAPPVSTTSSYTRPKATTKRDKVAPEHHDTATDNDVPSQSKRGRVKKSAAPAALDSMPTAIQASVASTSKPAASKETKTTRTKSSRSTSVSRVVDDEPMGLPREPSPEPKPKKGKATKKTKAPGGKSDSGRASPQMSETLESSVAEDEVPSKPTAGKKKASKKKPKKSRAVSVATTEDDGEDDDQIDQMVLELTPTRKATVDPDATPMPPSRVADSIGGWESFDAANAELEELAKELHIEGEFAAIGKPPKRPPVPAASSKKTSRSTGPPPEQPIHKAVEKLQPQVSLWDWREREKSVSAKSVVTETDMTEEEEVEKSLAGDDDDIGMDDEENEPVPSPPRSRAPSTALSRPPSTSASTTVSSKTKAKIKEARVQVLQDEEMADGETPKASRLRTAPNVGMPSRPPMFPTANFDMDTKSNPFLVGRGAGGSAGALAGIPAGGGLDSLLAQLEAPMISRDVDSRALTEEEREMTLEEWIRYDVERRKELIRREGRKWIETFLESAEGMREKIRAI